MATSLYDTFKKVILIPPHPAGIPFIVGGVIATLIFLLVWQPLGVVALILTAFFVYFFRDPDRVVPQKESFVLSPADGEVSSIVHGLSLPHELGSSEGTFTRISIFLSVVDVHVNRIPVSGKILRRVYTPGKFINADLDKASEDNERCSAIVETPKGVQIGVVQIAGLIARRILNDLSEGDNVEAGKRFGIIRFGSRLDVYVPEGTAPLVCIGQRAIGGETILADLEGTEVQRDGKLL